MGNAWRVALGVSALLWGCGGMPAPAPRRDDGCGRSTVGKGHTLQVYFTVDREGQRRPLCRGQDLTDSDTLWVTVELDTASFIRMVFVTPDGQTGEVIRQDAADMTREAMFRSPRGLMTGGTGEGQLVIVASRDLLDEVDPLLAAMLDAIRETGLLVDRDGSLNRKSHAAAQPEVPMFNVDSEETLHADFDAQGVAVLPLSLQSAR